MIGAGIAMMHYIGMAALRAPAQLHWDAGYVLASVAIAMTATAAAMRVSSWGPASRGRLMAVVLLVLAICGLHFTAMAAVTLVPDPLIVVPSHAVAPPVLAFAIATVMTCMGIFKSRGDFDHCAPFLFCRSLMLSSTNGSRSTVRDKQ